MPDDDGPAAAARGMAAAAGRPINFECGARGLDERGPPPAVSGGDARAAAYERRERSAGL
eukprot:SAG31_NODE_12595_length_930_cov_14.104693_1_plen_60_part_00